MKTGNVNWTKNDMARVIVQALFNTDKPVKANNIHVKRMMVRSKANIEDQFKRALKVLERRSMGAAK